MTSVLLGLNWKIQPPYTRSARLFLSNPIFHKLSPHSDTTMQRLGVKLVREYNELDTALDMKNNLGRNVLALFDPPHLSKLGKYFMCIQLTAANLDKY